MVTLYIGGLAPETDKDRLADMFGGFGRITETRVMSTDDGRCRGFAYVTFESDLAAAKARTALNGREVEGQQLRVAIAT